MHEATAVVAGARLATQIPRVTSFFFSTYNVMRRPRLCRHIALAGILALCLPAGLSAHGDPAGEALLEQDVFLPFGARIDPDLRSELVDTVTDANRAGFAVKVAVINTRYDLGIEFDLYGRPQAYASDLGRELSSPFHGHVLVVMPSGFGATLDGRRDPRALRLVRRLPAPGTSLVDEVSAATRAVRRLASASGYELSAGGDGSKTRDRLVIAAGSVALAALLAGIVFFRRGRS
jgi:hypothetical protein